MLWTAQVNRQIDRTLSWPRSRNCRRPNSSFIYPKVGSISLLLPDVFAWWQAREEVHHRGDFRIFCLLRHLFLPFVPRYFQSLLSVFFFFFHVAIAHSAMFGCVSLYLCSINRNMLEFYQPCFIGHLYCLYQQFAQCFVMTAAKLRYGPMVRLLIGGKNSKSNVFIKSFFYFSRRKDPFDNSIDKNLYHHFGLIRRLSASSPVVLVYCRQV